MKSTTVCRASCFIFILLLIMVVMSILKTVLNTNHILQMECSNFRSQPTTSGNELTDWFLENSTLDQGDVGVVNYIAKYHLEPPARHAYSDLVKNAGEPSLQGNVIQAIFKGQRNGFFLEAGAFDGISESNTLVLERDFGWNGILIEGNSFLLPQLRLAYRKAWISDVCLALTPHPQKIKYIHLPTGPMASMIHYKEALPSHPSSALQPEEKNNEIPDNFISAGYVECFPVFSILAALNITTVDYMSLDIEGAELKVLENIPFDRVDIKVLPL